MHHGAVHRAAAYVMVAMVLLGMAMAIVPASGQGDVTATAKNGFDEFSGAPCGSGWRTIFRTGSPTS